MLACDHVVLENQPCLTNPVMKSVQLVLFSYFMYRGVWCEYARRRDAGQDMSDASTHLPKVSLVSASNKLKAEMTGLVTTEALLSAPEKTMHTNGGGPSEAVAPAQGSKAAYKARKHDAIALADTLLDAWCGTDATAYEPWRMNFRASCKKEQDDLSDCLLQGLYVLRKPLVAAQAKAVKKAVAQAKRARKAASKAATTAEKAADKAARKAEKKTIGI